MLKGKPLAWGLSKKGYCAIIDGKVTIGTAENSPLFEEATEKEGYFFRQYPLVDRGTLVESELKNKTMRKALCDRDGQIFVAVSQTDESMHDSIVRVQENFRNYWGQRLVNVMRPLQDLLYNKAEDEEDDYTEDNS